MVNEFLNLYQVSEISAPNHPISESPASHRHRLIRVSLCSNVFYPTEDHLRPSRIDYG